MTMTELVKHVMLSLKHLQGRTIVIAEAKMAVQIIFFYFSMKMHVVVPIRSTSVRCF